MPTFLQSSHALDRFRCDLCEQTFPKALIHEHHVIKRASGGRDTQENVIRLCVKCHSAVHQTEMALKNKKRHGAVGDLVGAFFQGNAPAQRRCLELAATAAMGDDMEAQRDYSAFDNEKLVHLTPAKVPPKIKMLVMRLVQEMRHPKSGKKMGVSSYIRGLIETDLRKRRLL